MSDHSSTKVAIVTGGSSGIGRYTCLALAANEYQVVVVARNPDAINETLAEIAQRTSRKALGLALDVTVEADMISMVSQTVEHWGRIDLLVASAGFGDNQVTPRATVSLPLEVWQQVLNVNLTGVFLSNRSVLPTMIQQGSGQIINVCSSTTPHGLRGRPYAPGYCASKFGVVGFTESLAAEVAQYGIRVQTVFPGIVETKMIAGTALAKVYGGSMTPQTLAANIVYLANQSQDVVMVNPHVIPFECLNKSP